MKKNLGILLVLLAACGNSKPVPSPVNNPLTSTELLGSGTRIKIQYVSNGAAPAAPATLFDVDRDEACQLVNFDGVLRCFPMTKSLFNGLPGSIESGLFHADAKCTKPVIPAEFITKEVFALWTSGPDTGRAGSYCAGTGVPYRVGSKLANPPSTLYGLDKQGRCVRALPSEVPFNTKEVLELTDISAQLPSFAPFHFVRKASGDLIWQVLESDDGARVPAWFSRQSSEVACAPGFSFYEQLRASRLPDQSSHTCKPMTSSAIAGIEWNRNEIVSFYRGSQCGGDAAYVPMHDYGCGENYPLPFDVAEVSTPMAAGQCVSPWANLKFHKMGEFFEDSLSSLSVSNTTHVPNASEHYVIQKCYSSLDKSEAFLLPETKFRQVGALIENSDLATFTMSLQGEGRLRTYFVELGGVKLPLSAFSLFSYFAPTLPQFYDTGLRVSCRSSSWNWRFPDETCGFSGEGNHVTPVDVFETTDCTGAQKTAYFYSGAQFVSDSDCSSNGAPTTFTEPNLAEPLTYNDSNTFPVFISDYQPTTGKSAKMITDETGASACVKLSGGGRAYGRVVYDNMSSLTTRDDFVTLSVSTGE